MMKNSFPESRTWRLMLVLAASACFLGLVAQAAQPADIPADFPTVRLPAKMRGDAAISALGNKLPAVAAFYHLTAPELRSRLRTEESLWVDQYGRLFYVCVWPPPPKTPHNSGSLASTRREMLWCAGATSSLT